ncbi:MAG: DNA-3-methyladenine glycosylase [Bacteroidales bacterium]|jgi:DNA-3-methyladenine glycosylase|nr:DNA-3-methyladenine glycosylase [Bacteroidales bacterium]
MVIEHDYFLQDDVVFAARDLLGKYIFTRVGGQLCGGMIFETEAYKGITDKASHAFGGRRTRRNEAMYAEGGIVYVYLCYGMHHLLNLVFNREGAPDAVLIRGILLTHGEELVLQRTGKTKVTPTICQGPGRVSKALGITVADNALQIPSAKIWLEDRKITPLHEEIKITPRIGVDYAGEDAALPYRFVWKKKLF